MRQLWLRLKHNLQPDGGQQVHYQSGVAVFVRRHPVFFGLTGALMLLVLGIFAFFYLKYAMMIQEKFGGGAIRTNSSVYALPRQVAVGDQLPEAELIARLQRAG